MTNRDTNGRFSSFKAWVKRTVRWTIKWSLITAGFVGAATFIGAAFFSQSTVTYAEKEVKVEVQAQAPVLDRIASCESGGKQFGKDGQVVIHVNNNGTYDQGKYQINSIHNAAATKLGFNLSTEEGNEAFAKWMYANLGTGDWASSQACWKVVK